jgi:hypothetical protein
MQTVELAAQHRMPTIDRQNILSEIVTTDRKEVRYGCKAIRKHGRRRRFHHTPHFG